MSIQPAVAELIEAVSGELLGKRSVIEQAVTCLLAGGHLLIEDLPGTGKTTLARALATGLQLQFKRIQFTSDLLPGDLLGTTLFHESPAKFEFVKGPLFAQLVLADELNRATPRTQSAFLEAMEEGAVTVDGERHALPEPFSVIATQNPREHTGVYDLPESQLDRFLMKIEMGQVDRGIAKGILLGAVPPHRTTTLNAEQWIRAREEASATRFSEPVAEYVLDLRDRLAEAGESFSIRAWKGVQQAARAHAWLQRRAYVIPEDVDAVIAACLNHRARDPRRFPELLALALERTDKP